MNKLTDFIKGNLTEYDIEYRVHATRRIFQRGIHQDDIELILRKWQVVEQYSNDFPLPSLLLKGKTIEGRPLHIVIATNFSEQKLIIITARTRSYQVDG